MAKSREQIPENDRWNVGALYPDVEIWLKDFLLVQESEKAPHWATLQSYRGRLKDPVVASAFFDVYLDLDRKLSKLSTYAHLRMDEDVGNDQNKSNYGKISTLQHAFQLESSWIVPEILSLSDSDYAHLLKHPLMKNFQFFLENIGRMRAHTLAPEQEELLAMSGKALETAHSAFGALNNADLHFSPAIDSQGKEHPLSHGSYLSYLRSPDRNLRKTAFINLHKSYDQFANTICELIQGQVQSHLFAAKSRKFSSCLEAALYPHAVDTKVYTNLIATVRKNLPKMHEYIAFRKKKMKLDTIHVYDLYAPIAEEVKMEMSYPEACQVIAESVSILGKEYQNVLKSGLTTDRWVDVFENVRKRSGAYSSGCYDSMPYILMNYHGTFGDVTTLAHEAGHSMHSYLSRANQPYIYSRYPIFVAEVASTFNEQLLLKLMKERAKSKSERAYLINDEIERIRGTIFRQTMFAEFELQLHKWAEEGVTLTPELLKKAYIQLNRDYYGPDLTLDPELEIEWARIPHFYYNFYVYQYATGLSAAMALNQLVLSSSDAKDRYLAFLSSGGSQFPLDLLEKAGVNMRSSEPIDAAMAKFQSLVEEFKSITK
ncbi:MAG TPA: oligoendopeptidase F [Chlamydiales bacterium]|nr:oligoendopeptidase F [Chlamydiales bacterium]